MAYTNAKYNPGQFWTDGKRLAWIVERNDQGGILMEDCRGPIGTGTTFWVNAGVLNLWRHVTPHSDVEVPTHLVEQMDEHLSTTDVTAYG